MITAIYIAILALAQFFMVVWVVKARITEKVSLGTGDSPLLEARSRVYGNFTEVVPMALLLMLAAEFSGCPLWIIHWMGVLMILSRVFHAKGMTTPPGYGKYRMAGMLLSMSVFMIGAVMCLTLAYQRFL